MSDPQVIRVTVAVDLGSTALGFIAKTVLVDNLTDNYLYIPSADRFVEPQSSRAVIPLRPTWNAEAVWRAPGGAAQPSISSPTQQATLVWMSIDLPASPGMIGQSAGRPTYYDRNAVPDMAAYTAYAIIPHVSTARWTHVVPPNRSEFVEEMFMSIYRATAATVAGNPEAAVVYNHLGAPRAFFRLNLRTNGVGDGKHVAIGSFGLIASGDTMTGSTADDSTGGNMDYAVTMKFSAFDT